MAAFVPCLRPRLGAAVVAGFAALVLGAPPATAAEPNVSHGFVESFDGTPIAYTLFLPPGASRAEPVPVVLHGHGWGGSRSTTTGGFAGTLVMNGYAVLSWDARGFGDSGGEANVDSQEFEVRDVRTLIDFVATRPEIELDGPGDPRMGMTGGSYGGGIQLMTASADRRVDAIAPEIAWNDLVRSLRPGGVLKLGWGSILYGAGAPGATRDGLDSGSGPQTGVYAPQIHRAFAESNATNDWSRDTAEWFDARSPRHYIRGNGRVPGLRAPALIVQGANDTLFNLNEGIANWGQIRAAGVDAKLLIFCGGHTLNPSGTTCATDPPDGARQGDVIDGAVLDWLDRYVKGPLGDVAMGPAVEFQLQDGSFATARDLARGSVRGEGSGRLVAAVVPTSGVLTAATPAPDGVRIDLDVAEGATVLGIPRARVTASVAGPDASLFFKLIDVDPEGGAVVVDDQATPYRIRSLTPAPRTFELDLAGVSWRVAPGHRLQLEVSATSSDHSSSRTPAVIELDASVAMPVLGAVSARAQRDAEVLGRELRRGRFLARSGFGVPPFAAAGAGFLVAGFLLRSGVRRPRASASAGS